jgi:GMP reductase
MEIKIQREYNYSDINLIPNQCIVDSRNECDTRFKLGKYTFEVPVVPANMKTVVDIDTCIFLAQKNWFYIYHRFDKGMLEVIDIMRKKNLYVSLSIGVNEDSYKQLNDVKAAGVADEVSFLTLDIAHADSPKAERMIKYIKDNFPNIFLISGNVATGEAVARLESYGTDATKIGISNGHVCETAKNTGFSRSQFSTDLDCCSAATKPIISDGAASSVGCIIKSLVAGSSAKMCGNLFAGWEESAGTTQEIDGHLKKEYYGSASKENKGKHSFVEGKRVLVDYKGPMETLLYDIKAGIASGISYAGGKDLSAFSKVRYTHSTPRHW